MKIIVFTHIISGVLALVVAPVALLVKKGGYYHRLWGKAFFWSMTGVFITAVILSLHKWIPFLLMIGVFSYYSVVTGYRSLYHKQWHKVRGVSWVDWLALTIAGLFNLWFVGWGIYHIARGSWGFFAWLALGFGIAGLITVYSNGKSFLIPPRDAKRWFYEHIGAMMGGYIATVTAFSTQVMLFMPGVWRWIWPTLIGVPLIALVNRYYRRKFSRGEQLREVVHLKFDPEH